MEDYTGKTGRSLIEQVKNQSQKQSIRWYH